MRVRGAFLSLAAAVVAACLVASPAIAQDTPAPTPGSAGERVSQIEAEANAAEAVVKDALAHCDPASLVFAVMRLRQLSAEINNIETQGRRAAAAGFPVTVDVSAAAKVRVAVDTKLNDAAKIVINICRRRWTGASPSQTGAVQPAERILEEIQENSQKPQTPADCDPPESVFDELESDWAEKAALGNSVGAPTTRPEGLDNDDARRIGIQQDIIESVERAFEQARRARASGDRRQLSNALLRIDEDAQDLWDLDAAPDSLFKKWREEWDDLRDWLVGPEPQSARPVPPLDNVSAALFAYHNDIRAKYKVPPLKWDQTLADGARQWAQVMASTGELKHSPRDSHRPDERESIVISRHGANGAMKMVKIWGDEEKNVNRQKLVSGANFDEVCNGEWTRCGHFIPIVWSRTTELGCAFVEAAQFDALVCRYSPKSNIPGKPVIDRAYLQQATQRQACPTRAKPTVINAAASSKP